MAEALLLGQGLTEEIREKTYREKIPGFDETAVYAFTRIEREGLMVIAARHDDDQMA
jgi:hypothetical protein